MMTEVRCSYSIPEVAGLENNQITVGRHLLMSCEGTWDRQIQFEKSFFETTTETENLIRLLKVQNVNQNHFEIDFTVYQAGELQINNLVISDGQIRIPIGSHAFKVESMIIQNHSEKKTIQNLSEDHVESNATTAQTEQPAKPEPFGYNYFKIEWPWIYTVVILSVLVLGVVGLVARIQSRQKRKRLLVNVQNFDSPLEPDIQFYRQLKKIEKDLYPVEEVIHQCRVYILRRYQVPVFDLTKKQIIREIKDQYPRLKEERRLLFQIMTDMELLTQKKDSEEVQKFLKQFLFFIDKTEKWKKESR